jgi:hypothetical protein
LPEVALNVLEGSCSLVSSATNYLKRSQPMKRILGTSDSSTPKTHPIQIMTTSSSPVESPSAWMQYGTSPTEIILATAVVIAAMSGVIGAIALLLRVLVPVMQKDKSDHP